METHPPFSFLSFPNSIWECLPVSSAYPTPSRARQIDTPKPEFGSEKEQNKLKQTFKIDIKRPKNCL